jgi:hypothetical protein
MEPMTEANAVSPLLQNNENFWKGISATKKPVERLLRLVTGFHSFKHWILAWLACLSRAPPDPKIPGRERSPPVRMYSPFLSIKSTCLVAFRNETGALSPVFCKGVFNEYYF